jgi:hypothetical protein
MMSVLLGNLHELTCERLDIRSLLIDKLRAHESQHLMTLYVAIEAITPLWLQSESKDGKERGVADN